MAGSITMPNPIPTPTGAKCLDCAAVLYTNHASGELVDGWGESLCSASYRPHVPDLPHLPVSSGEPAALAKNPSDRLRRTVPLAGAGAVPDSPPRIKLAAQDPSQPAPLEGAAPGSILRSGLTRGPAGPVPRALRAGGEEHAPARPRSGPNDAATWITTATHRS
jgi:hypothetical protein